MSLSIQNRNNAFYFNSEKLSLRRKTVYDIIKNYGLISSQQIKEKMKLGINQVSGRVTELKDMFLIIEEGSLLNSKSNVKNTMYRVTTINERINLTNTKYQELINEKKELENDFNLRLSEAGLETIKKRVKIIDKQIKILENLN